MLLKYIVLACGIRIKKHFFTVINTRVHDGIRIFNALFLRIIIFINIEIVFFPANLHVVPVESYTGKGNSSPRFNESIK